MYASKRKNPETLTDMISPFGAALIPNLPIYFPFRTEPMYLLTIPPIFDADAFYLANCLGVK